MGIPIGYMIKMALKAFKGSDTERAIKDSMEARKEKNEEKKREKEETKPIFEQEEIDSILKK